jgi:hypothetical protein
VKRGLQDGAIRRYLFGARGAQKNQREGRLIVFIDETSIIEPPHEFELKRPAYHGSQQTQKRTAPRRNIAPMAVE